MKIAYSCVVDSSPKFEWQALLWAHSLLRHTNCRAEDLKIHCLPGVTKIFRKSMEKLNVDIVEITPFESGYVYCNKIQQCFSPAFSGYDKIVLTDTDLFFLDTPDVPSDKKFGGKIVDVPVPSLKILKNIYKNAKISFPDKILVGSALTKDEYTFKSNINGGFYYIDANLIAELGRLWKKYSLWLINNQAFKFHSDQVALALALDDLKVDYALLPADINCPVHLPEERLAALKLSKIQVLHYHSRVLLNGEIMYSNFPKIDEVITLANIKIGEIIDENLDNLIFWNNRNISFSELETGRASQTEILKYKRELLCNSTPYFRDKTVIEVGCGDLEVSKGLGFTNYTGYDPSATHLEISRKKQPHWRFIQGSPDSDNDQSPADLVICLDVLMHQKNKEDYHKLLSNLISRSKERLIISGFEKSPKVPFPDKIFHEPLSYTLRKFGVFQELINIGTYGDVSIFVADKILSGPTLHMSDIPLDIFNTMAPLIERRDILRFIIDTSRNFLGFFTRTSSRTIEYPWVIEKMANVPVDYKVLDIGAGLSPIPIILANRGINVSCVDSHSRIRNPQNQNEWNEWGYLDYSLFSSCLQSFNTDILTFEPKDNFDVIYSISVLEHMPRIVWEKTLELLTRWLRPGGLLLLTLDMIPGTLTLWNKSEGRTIDPNGNHGLLKDITDSLKKNGFVFEEFFAKQNIPYSQTDVAFLKCWLRAKPKIFFQTVYPQDGRAMIINGHERLPQAKTNQIRDKSIGKKLYLHIGTPKTGTSSLQSFLFENYDSLKCKKILYPKSAILSSTDPKHQPLFSSIYLGNKNSFDTLTKQIIAERTDALDSIIISSEGFYNHIHDTSEASWVLLKEMADIYHLQVLVYLRPQVEYLESLYRQKMKNPRGVNVEFGSSLTIHEMMERPKIRQNLDYYDSLMKWAKVVGDQNIVVRRYSKNIIDDFLKVLQVRLDNPKNNFRRNLSITREMAEILRLVNSSIEDNKRNILINHMEEYLRSNPFLSDQPFLSPEEQSGLMSRYHRGNTLVAQKWFHDEELFPGYRVKEDLNWQPVVTDNDYLMGLLRKIYNREKI